MMKVTTFFQLLNRLIDMLLSGLLRFRNQLKSPGESSVAAEDQPFDMSPYTIATLDMQQHSRGADSGRSETDTDGQVGNVFPTVSST